MAVYSVDTSTGKAPTGLSTGDYVVTKNGTYVIDAVNADGTYKSSMYNSGISLSNYNGQLGTLKSISSGGSSGNYNSSGSSSSSGNYSSSGSSSSSGGSLSQAGNTMNWGGSGATVTNPGEGVLSYNQSTGQLIRTMPNGTKWYVNKGDEKWNALYQEYLNSNAAVNDIVAGMDAIQTPTYQAADTSALEAQVADLQAQLANQQYAPVDQSQYTKNVMTYDEAIEYATQLLSPQYETAYQKAADIAAQNLDRAGIGNSLYGQQLAMSQQNAVTNEMQQSINNLALSMVGQDREYALSLLNSAINENQFGASYHQAGLSQAANLSISLINNLVSQAQAANDYNLQATSLELQKQAQKIEALYTAGVIDQTKAETELLNLEIEATKAAQTAGIQVSNGTGSLPNGTGSLPNGTGSLPNGTGSLPNGTGSLPNGTDSLPNGTDSLPNGTNIFYQVARNVRSMYENGRTDEAYQYIADRVSDYSISTEQGNRLIVNYGLAKAYQ